MIGSTIGEFTLLTSIKQNAPWSEGSIPVALAFIGKGRRCLLDIKVTVNSVSLRPQEFPPNNPSIYKADDVVLNVKLIIPITKEKFIVVNSINGDTDLEGLYTIVDGIAYENTEEIFTVPGINVSFHPLSINYHNGSGYRYESTVELRVFDMDEQTKMIYSANWPLTFFSLS